MYVDSDYYVNEYQGVEIEEKELKRLLIRANRDIELLTNGVIDFDNMTDINKKRVKNAVSAQVEFLYENGELASSVGGADSFSIGSYSESKHAYSKKDNPILSRYAPSVFDWLKLTGLLYGIHFESVDYI
ncbi:head-tail connector protein [Helcococcus kunzii]|uniref:hypothetical protein n=1 Tax=Helcococcus kunzii TaxID=40091 RepID=UPI0038AAAF30